MGRYASNTGIAPLGQLIDQILMTPDDRKPERIFVVVDIGAPPLPLAESSGIWTFRWFSERFCPPMTFPTWRQCRVA